MIIDVPDDNSIVRWKKNDKDEWQSAEIFDLIMTQEKLNNLEKRIKQLECIIANLTYNGSTEQICVYEKADNYYIKVPLHRYIHEYCNDFKESKEK